MMTSYSLKKKRKEKTDIKECTISLDMKIEPKVIVQKLYLKLRKKVLVKFHSHEK